MCGSDSDPIWRGLLALSGYPEPSEAAPQPVAARSDAERTMLDLYESFASAGAQRPAVVAHLGQSIDGFIATGSGDSYYVTGPANLDHLHRMRALADAVVVGAGTVAADNPSLTTRRVAGSNPVRIVLDGRRRLDVKAKVFSDDAAPTILVCAQAHKAARHGLAEVLALPHTAGLVSVPAMIAALAERGLHRIFVEGGGRVVSAFLAAGVLDRLQLAVAPVMIGEGRRGVVAPAFANMRDSLRPPFRLFRMGEDLLYDYELRASEDERHAADSQLSRLR